MTCLLDLGKSQFTKQAAVISLFGKSLQHTVTVKDDWMCQLLIPARFYSTSTLPLSNHAGINTTLQSQTLSYYMFGQHSVKSYIFDKLFFLMFHHIKFIWMDMANYMCNRHENV